MRVSIFGLFLGGELPSWAPLAKALDVLGREYVYAKPPNFTQPVVFYVVHFMTQMLRRTRSRPEGWCSVVRSPTQNSARMQITIVGDP